MNTTEIRCRSGHVVLVDSVDADGVLRGCSIHVTPTGGGYARSSVKVNGKWKSVLIHRLLMNANPTQFVDHINGNRLDNRRANLRMATMKQNSANSAPKGRIPYSGVSQRGGKFSAIIYPDGDSIYLGVFHSADAAAAAYNAAARVIFSEFARLNNVAETGNELDEVIAAKELQIARLKREINILNGGKNEW